MALLRSFGSIQIRNLSGLTTVTMLLIHGVGSSTLLMIPLCSKSSILALSRSFSASGTLHGTCWTGLTDGSMSIL